MRKFYLTIGSRLLPLNGEESIYTRDPSGFGVSNTAAFFQSAPGVFEASAVTGNQDTPGFTLVFSSKDPYGDYQELMEQIAAAGEVLLGYAPKETIYYRRVLMRTCSKTERNVLGWLEVPVTFWALEPWHLQEPVTAFATMSSTQDFTLDLPQLPAMPSPMVLSFLAPAKAATIQLVGVTSRTVYADIRLPTLPYSSATLTLDTRPGKQTAIAAVSGKALDALPYLDLSGKPFALIPASERCQLHITSEAPISGSIRAAVYPYYIV